MLSQRLMTALFIKLLALASVDLLQKQHFTPLGLYLDKTEAKMGGGGVVLQHQTD